MTKQEHLMFLLGKMNATLHHITSTSYKDMSEAQSQMITAKIAFAAEIDEIFAKPDTVTPGTIINIHGDVKLWTSQS